MFGFISAVNGTRLHYVIDSQDRIVDVGDGWDAFAIANGGASLVAEAVVGRSLWDFVAGEPVRALYEVCFLVARQARRTLRLDFRCDSPLYRRHLLMRVAATPSGMITLSTITKSLSSWPTPSTTESAPAGPIVMCGLCRAVRRAEAWVDVDDWVARHGPSATFQPDHTRYVVCDVCREAATTA